MLLFISIVLSILLLSESTPASPTGQPTSQPTCYFDQLKGYGNCALLVIMLLYLMVIVIHVQRVHILTMQRPLIALLAIDLIQLYLRVKVVVSSFC